MAAQLHFGAGNSVEFGSTGSSGVGASQGFAKTALTNLAVGDLLVAWFAGQSSTAGDDPTPPSGWVRCGSPTGTVSYTASRNSGMWYYAVTDQAALDALPDTISWTFSTTTARNGRGGFVVARATGIDLSNPVDSASDRFYAHGNSVTSYDITGITTTHSNTLLVGGVFRHNSASTGSPTTTAFMTEFTEYRSAADVAYTSANTGAVLGYTALSTAGATGNQTITLSGVGSAVGGELVAFKALDEALVTRATVVSSSVVTVLAGSGSSRATAFTINRPDGLTDGDLMIVTVSAQSATSTGDFACTGWTRISAPYVASNSSYRVTGIFAKPVPTAASEISTSYTFTSTDPTGGRIAATAFIVRGADLNSITAGVPSASSNTGTSLTTTLSAPTANRSLLLLSFNGQFTAGNSYTAAAEPSGMTLVGSAVCTSTNGSSTINYVYAQDVEAVDQGNRVITWAGSAAQSASAAVYIRSKDEPDYNPGVAIKYTSAPDTLASASLFYTSAPGVLETPYEVRPFPAGYSSVTNMLAQPEFFVAHRGGSRNWPEMSLHAYTQSGFWGVGAFELSLARTSDGVWFGLHDNTLDRTSGTTNFNPAQHTWAEVQNYQISVNSWPSQPYMRFEEAMEAYYNSHVFFVDIKYAMAYREEFLSMLDAMPGNPQEKFVCKYYGVSVAWPTAARAHGYKTWGYFYEADVTSGNLAGYHNYWDILGMDYTASQAAWDAALSYNKPVMAHILVNASSKATALAKATASPNPGNLKGYMVAGVKETIERSL